MARWILNTASTLAAVAALAGCGGSGNDAASTTTPAPPRRAVATSAFYPDDPQVLARASTAAQKHDLELLWRDTLGMRRVARRSTHSSLHGDPPVRRATARFLEDLDGVAIDNLSKNRAIDHAAAAVATVCEQCFQQLEASRPIVAIAH